MIMSWNSNKSVLHCSREFILFTDTLRALFYHISNTSEIVKNNENHKW